MLHELVVRNLGVIEEAVLVLGPGLTALTGETGAGKTLVTEAVALLGGGRADPGFVRPGADEAEVEGRFVLPGPDGDEVIVRRVIPADGRSRAYIDGRLATAGAIVEAVGDLIDLHGQHGQQTLLRAPSRRAALDQFGSIDPAPLAEARHAVRQVRAELSQLGGDDRARAREIELLRYQIDELEQAGISDPEEDQKLIAEESLLGDATSHRESAIGAGSILGADGVVGDGLARALGLIGDRKPFATHAERLHAVIAEVTDIADELRGDAESIPDDPARLVAVGERRRVLAEIRRKYGATLTDVIEFASEANDRLATLEAYEARAAEIEGELERLVQAEVKAAAKLGKLRRKAAPELAARVQERLQELALPSAQVEVAVSNDPDDPLDAGDNVDFLVSMNPGSPPLPIAKVASGGELSRVMLALQLVVADAPPTIVFDEIDAGVGGQAATAVGRALNNVARGRQVMVVTHLAQVAAFANQHVHIAKSADDSSSVTTLSRLDDVGRVVELSRMLSGSPDSETAQSHAAELLAEAGNQPKDRN